MPKTTQLLNDRYRIQIPHLQDSKVHLSPKWCCHNDCLNSLASETRSGVTFSYIKWHSLCPYFAFSSLLLPYIHPTNLSIAAVICKPVTMQWLKKKNQLTEDKNYQKFCHRGFIYIHLSFLSVQLYNALISGGLF